MRTMKPGKRQTVEQILNGSRGRRSFRPSTIDGKRCRTGRATVRITAGSAICWCCSTTLSTIGRLTPAGWSGEHVRRALHADPTGQEPHRAAAAVAGDARARGRLRADRQACLEDVVDRSDLRQPDPACVETSRSQTGDAMRTGFLLHRGLPRRT